MVGTPTNKYYTKPKSKFRFCFSYLNVLFNKEARKGRQLTRLLVLNKETHLDKLLLQCQECESLMKTFVMQMKLRYQLSHCLILNTRNNLHFPYSKDVVPFSYFQTLSVFKGFCCFSNSRHFLDCPPFGQLSLQFMFIYKH